MDSYYVEHYLLCVSITKSYQQSISLCLSVC